ncbi:hypothetical protein Syun_017326 [Stephania yunnanensis]|uniref:Protein kinase domain-containing protein n=1 Tax=Stephania yunnanensis TaxID=152371 RepID=A0AAP0P394_9MAGN
MFESNPSVLHCLVGVCLDISRTDRLAIIYDFAERNRAKIEYRELRKRKPKSRGSMREDVRPSNAAKSKAPQKVLPIETPTLSLDELNKLTGNFGQKALVGEGSYGRVFRAILSDGRPASIKKFDSSDPDFDFVANGAARGLEYLHEKVQPPIVHRDVRYSNVLLFDDFLEKMADFSLTDQSSDSTSRLHSTRALGTFGYHAPE